MHIEAHSHFPCNHLMELVLGDPSSCVHVSWTREHGEVA